VPDLPVADQKNAFKLMAQFYQVFEVVYARKNCQAYFYATCSNSACPKNNTSKKNHA
jgi:hypothetical protein